jgi:hypothetical protein
MKTLDVIRGLAGWEMRTPASFPAPLLPRHSARIRYDQQRNAFLQATSTRRLAWTLLRKEPRRLLSAEALRAVRSYRALRRRLAVEPHDASAFHAPFLAFVNPALRERLAAIFGEYARPEHSPHHAAVVDRTESIVRGVTELLERESPPRDSPVAGPGRIAGLSSFGAREHMRPQ